MTLKTSDMAICAEVSQFTIREYGEQGLLGPIFRSRNNSYRSFDPLLIPQMYLVKTMRELGCTPQQIREYGQSRTPEKVLALFREYGAQLTEEMAALQAKKDVLESRIALIEAGQNTSPGNIELCTLPEQPVRRISLEHFSEKSKSLERLRRAIGQIRQDGNIGCPMGYAYHSYTELMEKPAMPAQIVSYDPQGPDFFPAGDYLVGTVVCYYGQPNGLVRRIQAQAERDNLEFCGPVYSAYLLDVASVTEPEQYLLRIAACVSQAAGS